MQRDYGSSLMRSQGSSSGCYFARAHEKCQRTNTSLGNWTSGLLCDSSLRCICSQLGTLICWQPFPELVHAFIWASRFARGNASLRILVHAMAFEKTLRCGAQIRQYLACCTDPGQQITNSKSTTLCSPKQVVMRTIMWCSVSSRWLKWKMNATSMCFRWPAMEWRWTSQGPHVVAIPQSKVVSAPFAYRATHPMPSCRDHGIDQSSEAKVKLHSDASVDAISNAVLRSEYNASSHRRKRRKKGESSLYPSRCVRINVAPIVVKPSNSFALWNIRLFKGDFRKKFRKKFRTKKGVFSTHFTLEWSISDKPTA